MTIAHLVFSRKMKLISIKVTCCYFLCDDYITTLLSIMEATKIENLKTGKQMETKKWVKYVLSCSNCTLHYCSLCSFNIEAGSESLCIFNWPILQFIGKHLLLLYFHAIVLFVLVKIKRIWPNPFPFPEFVSNEIAICMSQVDRSQNLFG